MILAGKCVGFSGFVFHTATTDEGLGHALLTLLNS